MDGGKKEGDEVIIGGDFNGRTGREGRGKEKRETIGTTGEKKIRNSKDGRTNREGRKLVEKIEEWGWSIWNGNIIGEKEYTFTGSKGNTMIDYVIGDEETRERIREMKIGEKADLDHHSLEIWMKGETQRRRKKEKEQEIRKVAKKVSKKSKEGRKRNG